MIREENQRSRYPKSITEKVQSIKLLLFNRYGFTLLEIMISVAIVGVLFLIINKFTNITSRQSRVFSVKQQSDINFSIFKSQMVRSLSEGSIKNGTIIVEAANPYTIKINTTRYSCGCLDTAILPSGGPNFVNKLKGDFNYSSESGVQTRLQAVTKRINDEITRWINPDNISPSPVKTLSSPSPNTLDRPRPCTNNQVPVVKQFNISNPASPTLISSYPLAATPVNFVDNGGVVASRMYVNQSADSKIPTYIFLTLQ